jgi:hypothetical protein
MAHGYNLKEIKTKVLLGYLDKARRCGGIGYDPTNNHGDIIPIEELKAELTKREHIPNKSEAKNIRRMKAQGKCNEGSKKNTSHT